MSTPEPGSNDGKFTRGLALGCGIPTAVILGGILVVTLWPNDGGPTRGDAIRACNEAVEELLTYPEDASFNAGVRGENPWTVVGDVDAVNGFGVTVRAEYQCTVNGTVATVDYLRE